MKLVYTHPNLALIAQAQALIERAGIDCVIRNEYASGAIGELAPINAWPEVWVTRDRDLELATSIVQECFQTDPGPDWQCTECHSPNPSTFDTCWRCGCESPPISRAGPEPE